MTQTIARFSALWPRRKPSRRCGSWPTASCRTTGIWSCGPDRMAIWRTICAGSPPRTCGAGTCIGTRLDPATCTKVPTNPFPSSRMLICSPYAGMWSATRVGRTSSSGRKTGHGPASGSGRNPQRTAHGRPSVNGRWPARTSGEGGSTSRICPVSWKRSEPRSHEDVRTARRGGNSESPGRWAWRSACTLAVVHGRTDLKTRHDPA